MKDDDSTGLERRKEQARQRAKFLKDNIEKAKRASMHSQTPGVKVVGYTFEDQSEHRTDSTEDIMEIVLDYILQRGGFAVNDQDVTTMKILTQDRSPAVADAYIARITGLDEKYGLARKFFRRKRESINASKMEDGTIIEYSVESYKGFVSRTYYVVRGWEFYPFAQHNYQKQRRPES